MAKFKQTQIHPGVTKHRSNAVKVYCSEAIAADDIISVTGVEGDFLKVAKADADGADTLNKGLLYVADYKASSADYTPVAVPWKLATGVNTAGSVIGAPVFLSDTPGAFSLTPGTSATKVGTVLTVDASTGQILLAPQAFASTDGIVYESHTFDHTGATDVEVQLVQPAGTLITDIGHVTTTATVGSSNIVVRVGTASDGEEVIADTNYVTAGVSAIGESMQVANGSQGEAGASMSIVAKFPLYTATERTLFYRFQCSATISAGVIRPYIKYQYA